MAGSVIGPGCVVDGELTSQEAVLVEGTVRGAVSSDEGVTLEADAVVDADVVASAVNVAGQLTGNVRAAERVDIQAGGRLIGDVKTGRLTIADGSMFRGKVEMEV